MTREDLKEFLVPLCAGLMHPKVWDFCRYTSGGGMRWGDPRQRAYYLMVRFVQFLHIMWGLRCRYVHGLPQGSRAAEYRDEFLRAQRLAKLTLHDPNKYEALINGKWWPVSLLEAFPDKTYSVQILGQPRPLFDVSQRDIRQHQDMTTQPEEAKQSSVDNDAAIDTVHESIEEELHSARHAKDRDDAKDEDYRNPECCMVCLETGKPTVQCAECLFPYGRVLYL
jgi:hypothetical protein